MNEHLETELTKSISKNICITIIVIVIIIILFLKIIKDISKELSEGLNIKTYHCLDVDVNNKDKILRLIEELKQNININEKFYCDSIYKIEYINLFPDGTEYIVYCSNEENIKFSVDKVGEDLLHSYIYENGYIEKR